MYPLLGRGCCPAGFATSAWPESPVGPSRTCYALTKSGAMLRAFDSQCSAKSFSGNDR